MTTSITTVGNAIVCHLPTRSKFLCARIEVTFHPRGTSWTSSWTLIGPDGERSPVIVPSRPRAWVGGGGAMQRGAPHPVLGGAGRLAAGEPVVRAADSRRTAAFTDKSLRVMVGRATPRLPPAPTRRDPTSHQSHVPRHRRSAGMRDVNTLCCEVSTSSFHWEKTVIVSALW